MSTISRLLLYLCTCALLQRLLHICALPPSAFLNFPALSGSIFWQVLALPLLPRRRRARLPHGHDGKRTHLAERPGNSQATPPVPSPHTFSTTPVCWYLPSLHLPSRLSPSMTWFNLSVHGVSAECCLSGVALFGASISLPSTVAGHDRRRHAGSNRHPALYTIICIISSLSSEHTMSLCGRTDDVDLPLLCLVLFLPNKRYLHAWEV